MKKLLNSLLLPTVITAVLLLLMSASFAADDLITKSRNEFLAVSGSGIEAPEFTLIIDPGHGGADGGAVSISGGKESELNLSIGKKAELIAAFFGINTILSRDSEDITYPDTAESIHDKKVFDSKQRVELINSTPNAVVISIHQNKFDDSSVKGAQVFFRDSEFSVSLAEAISENFGTFVDKVRAEKQISDSIYIFKHINCPAVLTECGYISNSDENTLLGQNAYQNKLAISIITGFLQYEKTQISEFVGDYNESKDSIFLY